MKTAADKLSILNSKSAFKNIADILNNPMCKESVYIGKEVKSLSIVLVHQHVLSFIVSEVKVVSKPRRFKVVFVNKIIALVLVIKARCLTHCTCRGNKHAWCRFTWSVYNMLSTLFIREILEFVYSDNNVHDRKCLLIFVLLA